MSTNLIQTSFAAGELAPSIFARTDLTKYHSGAAALRNFFVDYRSGASTRPGSKYVVQAFKSSSAVRLIPFQTSILIPYILEFGDFYCRVISKGASVLEAPFNITAASQANPAVITAPGHNIVIGDWIFVTGIVGMTQLNGLFFLATNVAGNNITIATVNGQPINSLGYPAWVSGGTIARVYKFASPYAAADLALVKFVQITNTMYLTHPNYAPQLLTFTAPTSWAFAPISFGATISSPVIASVTATAGTGASFAYQVTAVDNAGQESIPSAPGTISNCVNITTTAGTITVSWAPISGAVAYNVYRAEQSVGATLPPTGAAFGFQQSVTGASAIDSNIVPNFDFSPPVVQNPFAAGNNPGCVCFFQQRIYYAGSNSLPQTFWGSVPGAYNNFNTNDPVQADSAITGTLVSLQVNKINSMLPMPGGLIILTAKGAWQLSSGSGIASTSAVTPINATASPQAYNGASDVPPIVVNQDVLYVQQKGAIVRDLTYNIYANIYTGADISVLSNHLFFNRQILQWAYAEEPFKLIWAIRDDGILLSLTFVKEQEMIGWARHDTLGLFQSVATVTEGQFDAVYFVVKRFLGSIWVQTIERMADRTFPFGAEDAWCVDCGIMSALPAPAANLTITGTTAVPAPSTYPLGPTGPALVATGTGNFVSDVPAFGSSLAGDVIRAGGGIATITQVLSNVAVVATITQPITAVLPNDPLATPLPVTSGNWTLARPATTFSGLDYLNGSIVSILADGSVVPPQQVIAGQITLSQPATKVIAGLGFVGQLQTMPLDVQGGETVQGKRKKIAALTVRTTNTRGLKAGRAFNTLIPIKELNPNVQIGQAIPLITGDERIVMDALWDVPGQICLQQDNPLPATVLGVIPEIVVGDTSK